MPAPPAVVHVYNAPRGKNRRLTRLQFSLSGTLSGPEAKTLAFGLRRANGQAVPGFPTPRVVITPPREATSRRVLHWTAVVRMLERTNPNDPVTAVGPGDYRLTVTPVRQSGAPGTGVPIEVTVKAPGFPNPMANAVRGIDYPPETHKLEEAEQVIFMATGEHVDPVWGARLTHKTDPTIVRPANYVWWVSELNYWVAEFLFLGTDPGPGVYDLTLDIPNSPSAEVTIPTP